MSFCIERSSFIVCALLACLFASGAMAASVAVPTYHYDTYRTGWNNRETSLTADNFPGTFGLVTTVALDDQVDAQPLLAPGVKIGGIAHDILYVATGSNTVYGIDASSGATLLRRNLGPPVPTPLGCTHNGPNVGITGTPVIDLATRTLYVIAYVNGAAPTYRLHALDIRTLADRPGSPVTVAASHTLTNGAVYTFNATVQRQRPGLIELDGNIYAAFGSFCDFKPDLSRGWVLGWNASTLAPLAANGLTDTQATSPTNYFLSSIWMSGYGISGSSDGTNARLQFSTGNSDCNYRVQPIQCPSKTTYDGVTNIQESIVNVDPNSASLVGIFTPSNVATMDKWDADLGGGGVLHLPTQSGSFPYLAVGAGKDGRLFLLNRRNMSTPLDVHQLGGCLCGPSYFVGSDGVARIVTSQGRTISTWKLILSPSPRLVREGSVDITTGQDAGFFTVVSSNGTTAGTAIIWAVSRPSSTTGITLYAFEADVSGGTYKLLFSSPAGSWPSTGGNANIVPVVANGKVYVASYKALTIFGAGGTATQQAEQSLMPLRVVSPDSPHARTGILLAIDGTTLTLETRSGQSVKIDASLAMQNNQVSLLNIGEPFTAMGSSLTGTGALLATSIVRAKGSGELWPADH